MNIQLVKFPIMCEKNSQIFDRSENFTHPIPNRVIFHFKCDRQEFQHLVAKVIMQLFVIIS